MQDSSIKCPRCGYSNDFGIKFCVNCGNNFQYTCPICNNIIEPLSKFCNSCGTELIWESTDIDQTTNDISPEEKSSTPKNINKSEKIYTNQSHIKKSGNYVIFIVIVVILAILIAGIFIADIFLK